MSGDFVLALYRGTVERVGVVVADSFPGDRDAHGFVTVRWDSGRTTQVRSRSMSAPSKKRKSGWVRGTDAELAAYLETFGWPADRLAEFVAAQETT